MINSLMAVKIGARTEHAPKVQETFTKYGCIITTRVGFHNTDENNCSSDGIIILHLHGKEDAINNMLYELKAFEDVSAKLIEFN